MSSITIYPNQCTWEKETQTQEKSVCEKAKYKRASHLFTLAPLMFGTLIGMPQVDLLMFGIVALCIVSGTLNNETYEEEFIRKLKEDLR